MVGAVALACWWRSREFLGVCMPLKADCVSEEQLISYSEGKLSDDERQGVAAHLQNCIWCQATLDWLQENLLGELDSDGEIPRTRVELASPLEAPTASYQAPPEGFDLSKASETTEPMRRLNGYEVVRVLGRGGYGIVYEAIDKVLHRNVAIKVLKRDFANQAISRRRFIREAQAGAAINHPNVVTIHGVDEAGEMPFLIMELITGESLRERIRRQPKLEIMDVLRISAQVAQGLAAAHAQGIIHRDVKPGNIMLVDSQARVKITDFGLARVKVENIEFTSRGLTVGTPAYMSPEQVRGEELDARSDLFALGCVIYAMLAGHSPFHGRTTLDIARRIDCYEPPPLTETHKIVPEFLACIVQRLLQKDRDQRYQSAAEVADVLNRHLSVLNQTPTDRLPAALRMQLVDSPRPGKRPAQALAGVAAVVLGLTVIGLGWNYFGSTTTKSLPPDGPKSGGTANVATPAGAAPAGAAPTGVPLGTRKPEVTVAKFASADFTSIGEALRNVASGGRVTILDDSEYVESIRVADAEQQAGVRLTAPQHATLRSNERGPVITIRGIPNFRLDGLKVVAPQAQFGIEITGACPGLVLEDIDVQRTSNSDGTRGRIAGVYLRNGASGSPDQPIAIRRLTLHSTVVGVVIGNPESSGAAPSHILLEDSLVQGLSREEATLLILKFGTQNIVVRRNIFARGLQGLSILVEDDASPLRCQIEHNTWHDVETWIAWNGPLSPPVPLAVQHNLIVDARQISPALRALPPEAGTAFVNNVLFNPHQADAEDFASFARLVTDFPILSWDASHADYLKPDFARLPIAGSPPAPIPGRYFEDSGR